MLEYCELGNKKRCIDQTPPEAHVGSWLMSLQLKLCGAPWCGTPAGEIACSGKQMLGLAYRRNSVKPFYYIWEQYLLYL